MLTVDDGVVRVLHVVVPEGRREPARETLESRDVTFVAIPLDDRASVLLEIPLPSDAIGDTLGALEEAGIETDEYTVIQSGEAALTATSETLEERYAGEYDPLTAVELRTKARDLSRDPGSYAALMILSALIATAGLLVGSPAIVVGSMVIAPIIGPALTASVGSVIGDRQMVTDSLWMQLYGLVLAVAAAATLATLVRVLGFVPSTLDLPTLDLVGVRLAPNALSLVVGVAAGTAAGIGLTTKGPTSIIGVMIAAALIPTAAATGLAIAWLEPALAIGSAVLLLVTLVAINLAVLGVLVVLDYPSRERPSPDGERKRSRAATIALAAVVAALTIVVLVATAQQVAVDREISSAVDDELADPAHENLSAVSIQTQYSDMSPFTGPRTVTVVVSAEGDGDPGELANDVAERIEERTGERVAVRVETVQYEQAATRRRFDRRYPSKGNSGS